MIIDSLCPPAVLYLGFSVIQIIIDLFRGQQNVAFLKIAVMIIFTILLNQLCIGGLTIISWFIVFIPFIMMTYVTTILLYVFGLNPTQGKHPQQPQQQQVQPDPRITTPPPPSSWAVPMTCANTYFGCCPNGVTAKTSTYGANCTGYYVKPYRRYSGYYRYSTNPTYSRRRRYRPTAKPTATATPTPTATATPTPTPSGTTPSGTTPSGTTPSGTTPSGTTPSGTTPSGSR
jgi:hypothetical protein